MEWQKDTYQRESLIPPVEPTRLKIEIDSISEYHIITKGAYELYLAPTYKIPILIREIGRLREKTFREEGEGTGLPCDLDHYDKHYLNLFIWDSSRTKIVGGYRLGPGENIYSKHGIDGFYLSSLFNIHKPAHEIMSTALELGRSFIIREYQKKHLPLLMLWRGILHYLLVNPEYKYLIGPVSISKYYSNISKSVIVAFIKKYCFDEDTAKLFTPRTAFSPDLEGIDFDAAFCDSEYLMRDLEEFLQTIEPGHIKVPVLLKQYAKQNAKFIGFNLDPNFSGALDGLMILNVENLPETTLKMLSRD